MRKNIETRSSATDEIYIDNFPIVQGLDGSTYTSVKAIRNSDIFAGVGMLAADIASLPIDILLKGLKQDINPISNLLNNSPNPYMNGYSLKFIMVANAILNGNSYVEIVRDVNGQPNQLYFIPSSDVAIRQDGSRIFYDVIDGKQNRQISQQDMIHYKVFTLDGITGISPLIGLQHELKMQHEVNHLVRQFIKNGTIPGGILKLKDSRINNEARERMKKKWQESYSGSDEAFKVLVMDATQEYQPLEVNTEILKLINTTDWNTKQISKVLKIPLHKMGISTSNMSLEQMQLDYIASLNSYIAPLTAELEFKLLTPQEKAFTSIQMNTSKFRMLEQKEIVGNLKDLINSGVYSINDALKELGLPPIQDGDIHLASLNYVPLNILKDYQLGKAKQNKNNPPMQQGGD